MDQLKTITWNWNSAKAAGKHLTSFAAGSVVALAGYGIISATDVTTLNHDLDLISNGVKQITEGVMSIVAIATAAYNVWRSARNASPEGQAASLVKEVPQTKVITTPEIAAAVPSPNVMSQTEAKIVPKL